MKIKAGDTFKKVQRKRLMSNVKQIVETEYKVLEVKDNNVDVICEEIETGEEFIFSTLFVESMKLREKYIHENNL